MIPDPIQEIAEDVLERGKRRRAKVRTLLNYFGYSRRREQVVQQISGALTKAGLRTDPDFQDEFLDNQVYFVPLQSSTEVEVDSAESMSEGDGAETEEYEPPEEIRAPVTLSIIENPTYRVSHFLSARKSVVSVRPDDTISQAITEMLFKDFDQLPVMQGPRDVKGVLSWKSIAQSRASGHACELVTHCMTSAQIVDQSDSMFEAVDRVLKYGCVLVRNQRGAVCSVTLLFLLF